MSSFGVVSTGFRTKTIETIIQELEAALRASPRFGPSINTQADSVLGQLVRIFADQLADQWLALLAVYSSFNPDAASGAALDALAAITGVIRLPANGSRATLTLTLQDGTTVPAGSLVEASSNGTQFATLTTVSNSSGAVADFEVEAEATQNGPLAANAGTIDTIVTPVSGWSSAASIVTQGSEPYSVAAGSRILIRVDGSSQNLLLTGGTYTAAALASELSGLLTGASAAAVNGRVRITSDTEGPGSSLEVRTDFGANDAIGFLYQEVSGLNRSQPAIIQGVNSGPFVLASGEILDVNTSGVSGSVFVPAGTYSAQELAGEISNAAPAGAQAIVVDGKLLLQSTSSGDNITLSVSGALSTTIGFPTISARGSSGDAILGRNLETDSELRLRRIQLLQGAGSSTVDAIRAAILQVANVQQATVFENATDSVDGEGRPPHSFEAIVSGGNEADIARAIFENKPAGIDTYRDPGASGITETVNDSEGNPQTINFSRTTDVPIFVEIDVTVDSVEFGDGDQPTGEAAVQEAVRAVGAQLLAGEDVIAIRLAAAPLSIQGLEDVTALRLGTSSPPTGTVNLAIAAREQATFDVANILVTVTTL